MASNYNSRYKPSEILFLDNKAIEIRKRENIEDILRNQVEIALQYQSIQREFSEEAKAVFVAGRELWKYYHSKPFVNVNANLYDIREYFQGRNSKGRMNSRSDDEKYMELISDLRDDLKSLAKKIAPKVYEYGFLNKV